VSITRSVPVIPLGKDNEGLYIGYTYVCERLSGGNGGYTQYHYTNHDNGHTDSLLANGRWHRDVFPSDPHCSRYFERGRLKKETSYNATGQAVAVTETVWNRYGSQGEDNPRAFLFGGIKVGHNYCSSAAYLHYCYKFLPSQKTETIYDINGQNPVTSVKNYGYNGRNQPISTTTTNSDGKTLGTRYDYAWETYPELGMLNRHILSPVALQTDIVTNPASNISNYVVKILKNEYRIENDFPVLSKVSSGRNASALETEVNYSRYDSKANLLQKIERDNKPVTYLWGYNHQYPVAEIKNATYDQIKNILTQTLIDRVASAAVPDASDLTQFNNLRLHSNLQKAEITTYEYKPLVGMTKQTSPQGIVTTYEYDAFGRLQTVKDHNGNQLEGYDYHYKNP
jgi:YD repeat-containing protein